MPPPLVHLTCLIGEHQREQIARIGGDRGLSAGARDVVSAGLLALQGDCALLAPVAELQQLVTRLSFVTGRRTASGAWWCPTNDSMPSPDQLNPAGDVVATPHGVALTTASAALVVDLGEGVIVARQDGRETSADCSLNSILPVVSLLPPGIIGLASSGPGRRSLGDGLVIERTGSDGCRLSAQGLGPTVPCELALSLAAELMSLCARSAARSVATREALERQLEVTP